MDRSHQLTFHIFWYKIFGKQRLLAFLLVLTSLVFLCSQVDQDVIFQIDRFFRQGLQQLQYPPLLHLLYLLYLLGDTIPAALIVVVSLVKLCQRGDWKEAEVLALGTLGILMFVGEGLKPFFARKRPLPKLPIADGFSFPSGHATGNFVLYFYLALIAAKKNPRKATYIYSFVTVLLILMGLASVSLQVHWLTDIIAGYAFGYLWLCLMLVVLNLINFPKQSIY